VIARDQGTPTRFNTTKHVHVTIDENYFKFKQSNAANATDRLELKTDQNMVTIDENLPNATFVARINVVNSISSVLDSAVNASAVHLDFKLITCNDTFSIDSATGQIYVLNSAQLDYERVREFIVQVECLETNRLRPGLVKYRTGRITMLVKLRNLNDNAITFTLPVYKYTIEENVSRLPSDLTGPLVQIDDLDLADGSSGDDFNVTLSLESPDLFDNFRIVKMARFVYMSIRS
jgi:hypothetical protein